MPQLVSVVLTCPALHDGNGLNLDLRAESIDQNQSHIEGVYVRVPPGVVPTTLVT